MSRRDRAIGIAAGIVLGVAVVAVFVFAGSEDTIDAPSLENSGQGSAPGASQREQQPEGEGADDGAVGRGDETPTIVVKGGEPRGGVAELSFRSGEEVRFRVLSDTAGEVHVHGYDIYKDVVPGEPAGIGFPAEFEGAFEVELHLHETGANVQIANLEVTPG